MSSLPPEWMHCSQCNRQWAWYRVTTGSRICTYCGAREGERYEPGLTARTRSLEARMLSLEGKTDGVVGRTAALERRLDQMQVHWLNRYSEEIKAERYDAWMGGVLSDIPTDALRRELDRRHRACG